MSFFFFKQKTAYEMRSSDWSSDVCSSDLEHVHADELVQIREIDAHQRIEIEISRHRRVVDQIIDAPERRDSLLGERLGRSLARHIDLGEQRLATGFADLVGYTPALRPVDVADDHRAAAPRAAFCGALADRSAEGRLRTGCVSTCNFRVAA